MFRIGSSISCVVLALVCAAHGGGAARQPSATSTDLFPLVVGNGWTYESREHGERGSTPETRTRTTIEKRIVGKKRIRLGPAEEVEAFEIAVVTLVRRSDAPLESNPVSKETSVEFAVELQDRVEIYFVRRGGNSGELEYERIHQWPRVRPSGATFEEVRWYGRSGRTLWTVTDVDFDVPYGKGKGIQLRWMMDKSPHDEGSEVILAPGVGIVFQRSAVMPCRGLYSDRRESLLSFQN